VTKERGFIPQVDVSFVIPSYDSQDTIADTIRSIESQAGTLRSEIVVVDSSAHDQVKEAAGRFEQVRYVHNPVRLYPGEARNLGARIVEGEYLAFIDSDVILQENWLIRLYSRLISIPGIKAAGGVIFNANPETIPSRILYWLEFSEFLPGSRSGFRSYLSSSNLLLRRNDFLDSPGFDSKFAMSEDMVLSRFFSGKMYLDSTTSTCHHHRTEQKDVQEHLKKLGFWGGRMRAAGSGRGTFFARLRWLTLLLPFYRTLAVLRRVIKAAPGQLLQAAILSPLVFWGSCYWAAGFYNGLQPSRKPPVDSNGDARFKMQDSKLKNPSQD
jgi:glycosyltransferase involved in cell wall biosynthesis